MVMITPGGRRRPAVSGRDLARLGRRSFLGALVAFAVAFDVSGAAYGAAALDGGAFGVSARVRQGRTRVDVPPSPEVVLPPDGAVQNRSAKLVVARQVFSAHALHVRSSGSAEGGGSVESLAELNDITFRDGLARASGVSARCRAEVGPDGKARITADSAATLRQSGNEVRLRPGRSVDLRRLGRVVFDERVEAPGHDSVTVNALHFFLHGKLGRGEVVVGRARCSVGGSGGGPPPAIPESPMAILLPGSALLIGGTGVGVVFARRRRRGRP